MEIDNAIPDVFFEIQSSISKLKNISLHRDASTHLPFNDDKFQFPKLNAALKIFNKIKPLVTIKNIAQETFENWNLYLQNKNELSRRDLKRICWNPQIVKQTDFLDALPSFNITNSGLKGLMYSYHSNFNDLMDSSIEKQISKYLLHFTQKDSLITNWTQLIHCFIGKDAPVYLAQKIFEDRISIEQAIKKFSIFEETEFVRLSASEVVKSYCDNFEKLSHSEIDLLLTNIILSPLVEKNIYKKGISRIILSQRLLAEESLQTLIIDFVLGNNGLGDPRMHPENWSGVDDKAIKLVIQWLSKEDINFFFELLFKDNEDKHGRKLFWLSYLHNISRSRALISNQDRERNAVRLHELAEKGRSYGELEAFGFNTDVSAFILDFGKLVVIEFNKTGNACYFYEKNKFEEVMKDSWNSKDFWKSKVPFKGLKDQKRKLESFKHDSVIERWQSDVVSVLASHGIRRA